MDTADRTGGGGEWAGGVEDGRKTFGELTGEASIETCVSSVCVVRDQRSPAAGKDWCPREKLGPVEEGERGRDTVGKRLKTVTSWSRTGPRGDVVMGSNKTRECRTQGTQGSCRGPCTVHQTVVHSVVEKSTPTNGSRRANSDTPSEREVVAGGVDSGRNLRPGDGPLPSPVGCSNNIEVSTLR